MNFFQSRKRSYKVTLQGLAFLFKTQVNFKIEIIAAILVISLGSILKINSNEWIIIFLIIFLVLILEAINTAIELLCDAIEKKQNKSIGLIKDISSAVVLLAVILALIIAFFIFTPYILNIIR